ncbi:MAG: hypothetical protein JO272_04985 [Pseudonocardiales bacterium]|nr:hypothetical protein [Pseudonocardiales bacterium]
MDQGEDPTDTARRELAVGTQIVGPRVPFPLEHPSPPVA